MLLKLSSTVKQCPTKAFSAALTWFAIVMLLFGASLYADSLDDALALIKCTRSDLAIPTDIRWRDPFRLEVIDHLLAHPLEVPDYCQTMAEEFANADSLEAMIALAGQRLEFRTSNTERPASNE